MDLDEIYRILVGREDVKYVVLYRGKDILKANIDLDNAKKIVEFAETITESAKEALHKLPSISSDVKYLTIHLQSGLALLFIRHGEYGLIVAAMARRTLDLEKTRELILKIREILEKKT